MDDALIAAAALSGISGLGVLVTAKKMGPMQPEAAGFLLLGAVAAMVAASRSRRAIAMATGGAPLDKAAAMMAPAAMALLVVCLALVGVAQGWGSRRWPWIVKPTVWLGGAALLVAPVLLVAATRAVDPKVEVDVTVSV